MKTEKQNMTWASSKRVPAYMHLVAFAAAARGARVLTTHAQVPEVAKTAVHAHALHALQIVAELGVESVRHDLRVFAILVVLAEFYQQIYQL